LILTALVSVILVLLFPSVIKLWYVIGSLFIPPMLLPLLGAYFKTFRISGRQTLICMILVFFVSLTSFAFGWSHAINGQPVYPLGIEPFFPGLIVSFLFYLLFHSFKKNRL